VTAPVSADRAYAAHLEREGDRPILAVAATQKGNALMADAGGPCMCTLSAYATTLTLHVGQRAAVWRPALQLLQANWWHAEPES
jgi:hypothetical protein